MDIKSYVEFELKSTYEKLSELFDIPLEKVMKWAENPGDLSAKYWNKILEKSYHTIDFMEAYEKPNSSALNFDYSYLNKNEKNQISEIFDEFDVTYVDNRITKYKNLVSIMQVKMIEFIKKPKVAFLGRSDAGKSSIINSLLGVDKMPVSWTPVTSIVVYIKHIEDRPAYMENSTYIFKRNANGELWDETKLDNKEYSEKWLIDSGDADLLFRYGTNQTVSDVGSAVVFIDSPLLKNCDVIDVPGITSGYSSDNKKATEIIGLIDIVVYLSQANGFLSEADIKYIDVIFEKFENKKGMLPLIDSMFFVASQTDSLNENFNENVCDILSKGAKRLYESLKKSKRLENITLEKLRERFFAYSVKIRFEEKTKFEKAIKRYFETYYDLMRMWMVNNSNAISAEIVRDNDIITCFKNASNNTKKFRSRLRSFKKKNTKTSKKLLKIFKKETTSLIKSQRIVAYKGFNMLSQVSPLKSELKKDIKSLFEEQTKILIEVLNKKYPCEFYEKSYERLGNLFDRLSTEITRLMVIKSAYKYPVFLKKIKRKIFDTKEIKEKIEPVIMSIWNDLTEYILCLYIFFQYEGYKFDRFHCFSLEEIYDSYEKNLCVKTTMEKIEAIIK